MEINFDDRIFNQDLTKPETFSKHFAEILNQGNPKDFPIGVFPEKVQNIIRQTNECLLYPVDFIGASILFASSLAIGNTYQAELLKAWHERPVLYLALVGNPGINKSHPLTFALKPIFEHDERSYATYRKEKDQYKQIEVEIKNGVNIELPEKPFWKKFIVSDYTQESLVSIHQFNKRGIAVYTDEMAGWFKNFNRYNKGSDQEFWLSNFSGKQISIDRKSQEPILIPLPFIGVAGTIQPKILWELSKDSRNENGFIDRILFAFPDNLKKEYWSETDLPDSVKTDWAQIIENLIQLPMNYNSLGTPEPEILNFSNEAKAILKNWNQYNTDLCNDSENESLAGIFSKFEIYTIRFALIIELLYFASGESAKNANSATGENIENEICANSAKSAIKLTEYFRKTAIKVNSIISNIKPIENLPQDKRKLFDELPVTFTTEKGLQIAETHSIPERTFKRFISNDVYFEKISHGYYQKKTFDN